MKCTKRKKKTEVVSLPLPTCPCFIKSLTGYECGFQRSKLCGFKLTQRKISDKDFTYEDSTKK